MSTARVAPRIFEFTVISGENFQAIQPKERVRAVVQLDSVNWYKTKTAESSSSISWNEKFLLEMPVHVRSITFEVQCKKDKDNRPIGLARVVISDFNFLKTVVLGGGSKFFTRDLVGWNGKPNGVINFSVREVVPKKKTVSPTAKKSVSSTVKKSVSPTGNKIVTVTAEESVLMMKRIWVSTMTENGFYDGKGKF